MITIYRLRTRIHPNDTKAFHAEIEARKRERTEKLKEERIENEKHKRQ